MRKGKIRRGEWPAGIALLFGAALAWPFLATSQSISSPSAHAVAFETDVLPILRANTCFNCHAESVRLKNLDLTTYAGIQKGSESGLIIVPGKPDESTLYEMLRDGRMPPGGKVRVSSADLGIIRSWIESGAKSAAIGAAFETDILPILEANNCLQCHGSALKTKDLNLSTYAGVLKGSESGPVVVPGKPDDSKLYHMVHDGLMPPGGRTHLSDANQKTIRAWIVNGACSSANNETAELTKVTQDDIIPIMYLHCTECHGLRRQEAALDLRSRASMLKGGKSGPVLVPGKQDESLLVQKARSGKMPPKKLLSEARVKPLSQAEVDKIVRWVEEGAPEVLEPPSYSETSLRHNC